MLTQPEPEQHSIDWESYGVEDAVHKLIEYAGEIRASDLFFTSHEGYVAVALRHLGAVRLITKVRPEFGKRMIATIKASAGADIADHLRPGEGRRIFPRENRPAIDLRLNSVPTLFGEDVSVRLLDRETGLMTLEQLELAPYALRIVRSLLDQPAGLILVTGPTGSGKTTTLYGCLQYLHDGTRKINTLEDPVEFVLDGVHQAQINPRIGLDFPDLLTACLRQAPDVMMVGEIRDETTAKTAVRAANSGHLVLATLHAPVAVAALQSMLAYGVNRTFLASSIVGILSQRLVRGLCPECRVPISAEDSPLPLLDVQRWMEPNTQPTVYRALGCRSCHEVGYNRRICIAEAFVMDPDLREMLIHGRHSNLELYRHAQANGMIDFGTAARLRVAQGDTTPEEVFRAVPLEFLPGDAAHA